MLKTLSTDGKTFNIICVTLFGVGSWSITNCLWVELPLMVTKLPEQWNLPAYITIIIQVANIGPLLFFLLTYLPRLSLNKLVLFCTGPPERLANYVQLCVGFMACLIRALVWDKHTGIFLPGDEPLKPTADYPYTCCQPHSMALFALTMISALLDCTSSVSFLPYLTGMPQIYLSFLSFGETLSGLLPSLLALIQGVGAPVQCVNVTVNGTHKVEPQKAHPPLFSVKTFIGLAAGLMALSTLSFFLLDVFGLGKRISKRYKINSEKRHCQVVEVSFDENALEVNSAVQEQNLQVSTTGFTIFALIIVTISSFWSNGFLPGIMVYATAAYSQRIHHFSTVMNVLASSITAGVISIWTTFSERHSIAFDADDDEMLDNGYKQDEIPRFYSKGYFKEFACWMCFIVPAFFATGFSIYVATKSPHPPGENTFGPALAVISWIVIGAGFTGAKILASLFLSKKHCAKLLRSNGMLTQIGALVGAIISYSLVVTNKKFIMRQPCE